MTTVEDTQVAGAVAIFQGINRNLNLNLALRGLSEADKISGSGVGAGRLNLLTGGDYVAKHGGN